MLNYIFALMGLGGAEILLLVLLYFGFIIWTLIDVIRGDFQKDINKLIWVVLIVCMPFFGSILYLIIGRSQKRAL